MSIELKDFFYWEQEKLKVGGAKCLGVAMSSHWPLANYVMVSDNALRYLQTASSITCLIDRSGFALVGIVKINLNNKGKMQEYISSMFVCLCVCLFVCPR